MTIDKIVIWLIVGALAGTLAGRLVTFSKKGLGVLLNTAMGMAGAVVGGILFWMFKIDLGLGEIKITLNDLISAFIGSLLCIFVWWVVRKFTVKKVKPVSEPPNRG